MDITRADVSDPATTLACFDVLRAAERTDDPHGPPWSLRRLRGWVEHPADPAEMWACGDEAAGGFHGVYFLILPNGRTATAPTCTSPCVPRRGGAGSAPRCSGTPPSGRPAAGGR